MWGRLFAGFRRKYASYGKLGGTVVLGRLSAADIDALEGFFGRSYHGQKSASVSAAGFGAALAASRFGEIPAERLLELYFGEPLTGKKELEERHRIQKEEILRRFLYDFRRTPANACAPFLTQAVRETQARGLEEWEQRLYLAGRICSALPYRSGRTEYLAVFAARLTGNPHAFDPGTADAKLLERVLLADFTLREADAADGVFRNYQRQRRYLAAGILLDDVSNYAMLYNVRARKKDGSRHAGMDGFCRESHSVQVPLAVLAEWERAECPNGRMYIVENPSIFSMLCGSADQSCAYMCMNGQPRLAGLLVLDLLAKAQTEVFYAGDLDPEGLLIAQKLSLYYRGTFHFWRMTAKDYDRGISEELISEKRLKMLDRIHAAELLPAKERLLGRKKAAYQERIFVEGCEYERNTEKGEGKHEKAVSAGD